MCAAEAGAGTSLPAGDENRPLPGRDRGGSRPLRQISSAFRALRVGPDRGARCAAPPGQLLPSYLSAGSPESAAQPGPGPRPTRPPAPQPAAPAGRPRSPESRPAPRAWAPSIQVEPCARRLTQVLLWFSPPRLSPAPTPRASAGRRPAPDRRRVPADAAGEGLPSWRWTAEPTSPWRKRPLTLLRPDLGRRTTPPPLSGDCEGGVPSLRRFLVPSFQVNRTPPGPST